MYFNPLFEKWKIWKKRQNSLRSIQGTRVEIAAALVIALAHWIRLPAIRNIFRKEMLLSPGKRSAWNLEVRGRVTWTLAGRGCTGNRCGAKLGWYWQTGCHSGSLENGPELFPSKELVKKYGQNKTAGSSINNCSRQISDSKWVDKFSIYKWKNLSKKTGGFI